MITKREKLYLAQTTFRISYHLNGKAHFSRSGESAYISFGSGWLITPFIPWRTIRISNHQTSVKKQDALWRNIIVHNWEHLATHEQELLNAALPLRFPWRKAYKKHDPNL